MAKVHIKKLSGSSYALSVTGGVAKAVELSVVTDDDKLFDACVLDDNCLDLVPGDEQVINIEVGSEVKLPEGGLQVTERHYGQ